MEFPRKIRVYGGPGKTMQATDNEDGRLLKTIRYDGSLFYCEAVTIIMRRN